MKRIKVIITLISVSIIILIPVLFSFAYNNAEKSIQLEYWSNVIFLIILILIIYGIYLEYRKEKLEQTKLEEDNMKAHKRKILRHYNKVESVSWTIKRLVKIILLATVLIIVSVFAKMFNYTGFPIPYLKYYMIALILLTLVMFAFYIFNQIYQAINQKQLYKYFNKQIMLNYPKAKDNKINIIRKSGLYPKRLYDNEKTISHYQYKLEDGIYITDALIISEKSDKHNIIVDSKYHEHSILYCYELPMPIVFQFKILSNEIDHIYNNIGIERNKYVIEGVNQLPENFLTLLDKLYRMNILDINITYTRIYIKKYIKIDGLTNKDMKYYINCIEKYRQDVVSNVLKLKVKK